MDEEHYRYGRQNQLIVCEATMVNDDMTSQPMIIIVNQAAYDKDMRQHESLLHTDQARMHRLDLETWEDNALRQKVSLYPCYMMDQSTS